MEQNIQKVDQNIQKRRTECEVYSRSVGYLRPISQWNKGKKQEFKERRTFQAS